MKTLEELVKDEANFDLGFQASKTNLVLTENETYLDWTNNEAEDRFIDGWNYYLIIIN